MWNSQGIQNLLKKLKKTTNNYRLPGINKFKLFAIEVGGWKWRDVFNSVPFKFYPQNLNYSLPRNREQNHFLVCKLTTCLICTHLVQAQANSSISEELKCCLPDYRQTIHSSLSIDDMCVV